MSNPYTLGRLTRTRADGSRYWSYVIQWFATDGKRVRISLGTTDKAAAPALARQLWSQHMLDAFGPSQAVTVGTLVETYLDTLPKPFEGWRSTGVNDPVMLSKIKGAERKRQGWRMAKPYWDKLLPAHVDAQTSTEYGVWRKRAANTMRHEIGPIYAAMAWAVAQKLITVAPPIKLPAIPESSIGHLTKEQFRLFLAECKADHAKLFAILAVTTGARATALLQLPWSSVDFERGLIKLRPKGIADKELKGRATVPINERLMPFLRVAKEVADSNYVIEYKGGPIASIQTSLHAASVRSGVTAHPHMFRHSAAVWMAEDRVPMAEIAAYLGHKDLNITVRTYARFAPDYLREAAKSLDW